MGWPELIAFVRHAESTGNAMSQDERLNCESATHAFPLTELGCEQAQITGKWLKKRFGSFDHHVTSHYTRASETMNLLAPGEKIYTDARLAEAQRGIYHTMSNAGIAQAFPEELPRKQREGLYHYRPFGGENWLDVELRIHSFMDGMARDFEGARVLVVTHGHWRLLLERILLQQSIEDALAQYKARVFPENASLTAFTSDPIVSTKGRPRYRPHLILTAEGKNYVPWEGLL